MRRFYENVEAEPKNVTEMMAILKSDLAAILPVGTKVRVEMEVAVARLEGEECMATYSLSYPRISFDMCINENE